VLAGASDHYADDFAEATEPVEEDDFTVDADHSTVTLTDDGLDRNLAAADVTLTKADLDIIPRGAVGDRGM
jgi:hypothetical protein